MFPSTSKNKGTSLWNIVPKSGLKKFCHGTATVGECKMNCDSGQTGIYGTSGSDERRANSRHAWHIWYRPNSIGSISCQFVVDLLQSKLNTSCKVVQQTEPMESESIQPTMFADARCEAGYTDECLTTCEAHRHTGAIGVN